MIVMLLDGADRVCSGRVSAVVVIDVGYVGSRQLARLVRCEVDSLIGLRFGGPPRLSLIVIEVIGLFFHLFCCR